MSVALSQKIAIVGWGISGQSAYRLLKTMGFADENLARFDQVQKLDYDSAEKMIATFKPQVLVVSPGVPLNQEWIQQFKQRGGKITSELSLAFEHLRDERVIAITGSVGKSTTTSLLGRGVTEFDPHAFVGGNLGYALADYSADLLEHKRKRAKWVILELSSFQLENFENLQCERSIITYLTPNHMERYDSKEDYYETKWSLVAKTNRTVVLNSNGGELFEFAKKRLTTKCEWTSPLDPDLEPYEIQKSALIGKHNQENLAMAVKTALMAGWPFESVQAMLNFPGLPHRLENAGTYHNVWFINDSKATTMDSVLSAVATVHFARKPEQKLKVLLGGRDKNLPWEMLSDLSQIPNAEFIFFGECAKLAQEGSTLKGPSFASLKQALPVVFKNLSAGDILLLSPGGSSLDEFKSFEARGDFFKNQTAEYGSSRRP